MTQLTGRIGGQYSLALVGPDKYRVSTKCGGQPVTMFTGEYYLCSKIMDFCVNNDAKAQVAVMELYKDGDPTNLAILLDEAASSEIARGRRKVAVVCEIETDVLEGENSVAIVNERLSAACQVAGVRIALIQASYIDPTEQGRMRDLGRIARQRDFLLDHFVKSLDGTFTFPPDAGGETFPCGRGQDGAFTKPELIKEDLGDRNAPALTELDRGEQTNV
jgi:hypothetical protein